MTMPEFMHKILDWLRAGYPEGIPPTDYVPLFAVLLKTHITEEEIADFARELASVSDEDTARVINEALQGCSGCHPGEEDLARVRGRLAAGGWPLARPDRSGPDDQAR
jgi:hypothetical protein